MDQRELESELQNMMKLHAEGVKQVKKMERIVRESDQRAKVSFNLRFQANRFAPFSYLVSLLANNFTCKISFKFSGCQG